MKQHKHRLMQGQALVEFALILTVLLMMIFLIIESARLMWGWGTVQNAAREGARYAITGRSEASCALGSSAKFSTLCADPRTASIVEEAHNGLSGLPLDETSFTYEEDYYYNIEVWGVDTTNLLVKDYGGAPGNSVVVRVTYRVPIITPFFRPLVQSIPLYGQVTMTNENFGQQGSATSQGQGLAAELPELPTPGPTPTFTPTPTDTASPTPGASPTPSETPSLTPSATPDICETEFVAAAVAGERWVFVMGEPGQTVTITDLTTGQVLGSQVYLNRPSDGRLCDGFADFSPPNRLGSRLVADHYLEARSSDGSVDYIVVSALPPTATPTASRTPAPTATPTQTPTPGPSPTPNGPFIYLSPNCQAGPNVQFTIRGFNWPGGANIDLTWIDGNRRDTVRNAATGPSFQVTWQKNGLGLSVGQGTATYQVLARAGSYSYTAVFKVPCDNATPPPATATPTATPLPADMIVVGAPQLISTPPIVAYQPVQYQVVISNTGDIDVVNQFFVDLFIDPAPQPNVGVDVTIPITKSAGYMAVSSLSGGASRVLTITSELGFKNNPPRTHHIYGMVDSIEQIDESIEVNNISVRAELTGVIQATPPTPTPAPIGGSAGISGIVISSASNWRPQYRARVWLIDNSSSAVVGTTQTDIDGFYEFPNARQGTIYSVVSCASVDNISLVWILPSVTAPTGYANHVLLPGPCSR